MSEKNEWIPWSGGECPITSGVFVELKFRDGSMVRGEMANPDLATGWKDTNSNTDVIAYRIIEPEHPKEEIELPEIKTVGKVKLKIESVRDLPPPDVEPEPVFPLVAYNCYRGSEHLGVVEIPDKPGMTVNQKQMEAFFALMSKKINNLSSRDIALHLIPLQRKYRLGKLI